jgi:hypothetical protein
MQVTGSRRRLELLLSEETRLLLLTGLVLFVTGFGLWASERWLLYGRLGFPADKVGHGPVELLAYPPIGVLIGVAVASLLYVATGSA